MAAVAATPTAGVLLAGGLSRRMGGGDKSLRLVAGRTILDRVVDRVTPQVDRLVLNANGDPARFGPLGSPPRAVPVIGDGIPGSLGPLAGVLAGMEWARRVVPQARWLLSVATDTPFLPLDLAARLRAAVDSTGLPLACATSGGRSHPVFGLWSIALAPELRRAITVLGMRKVTDWTDGVGVVQVPFEIGAIDPFFNANRPEDLVEMESLLRAELGF